MGKRLLMAMMLTLGVVLLTAGIASAASKYSDLTGTWSGPSPGAYWQGGKDPYGTFMGGLTLVITSQDEIGCFYGTLSDDPLIGTITTGKVITAIAYNGPSAYMLINAKLTGKKIQGSYTYFNQNTYIQTGNFELTKQLP